MNELLGHQIDHYRIDARLGEGGMGAVYRAYDLHLARNMALKVMHSDLASQQKFQELFIQEARSAARLKHRSIVDIHYFGMNEGLLYIVMDYIPGGSLNTHLKQLQEKGQIVQLREILIFVAQIADALGYAHRQGVIHRDVKPSNVMMQPLDEPDREGEPPLRAVVADFGLAKALTETDKVKTESDVLIGTYPYMSPEQCLHQTVDGRSDIYSLGVVLYQLATGKLPLNIKSAMQAILIHQRNETPPAPRVVCPVLPMAVEEVINKAIAKKPEDRFQTGEAVASALRKAANSLADEEVTQFESQATPVSLLTHLESHIPEPEPIPPDPPPTSGDQLVIAQKDHTPRVIPLNKKELIIGRSNNNDIVLDHTDISRHHARLEQTPSGWRILDLGSTNGTYVENIPLLKGVSVAFSVGKTVRLGPYFLHLRQAPVAPPPPPTLPDTYTQSKSGQIGVLVQPTNVEVMPGGHAVLQVEVINQGRPVDHFRLRVTEIPPAWVTISPAEVRLMPGKRGTLNVDIHPPQDSSATAGSYKCEFVVESTTKDGEFVSVPGEVVVQPFERFSVDVQPRSLSSGATSRVTIHNQGSAEGAYSIVGSDPAEAIEFERQRGPIKISAGQNKTTALRITAKKRPLLGRSKSLPFEFQVESENGTVERRAGQLEVRPLIPAWIPPLLGLLLGLCVAGSLVIPPLFAPNPTPTLVPNSPVLVEWSISPTEIALGQQITIRWQVEHAEEVTLEPFGTVDITGEMQDSPRETKIYTLIATNQGKIVRRSIEVVVIPPTVIPIDTSEPTPTMTPTEVPTQTLTPSDTPFPTSTITQPPTNTITQSPTPSSYVIVSEACCGHRGKYLAVDLQEDPPELILRDNDDGFNTRWRFESSGEITRIQTLAPGKYFNCFLDINTTSGDVKIYCDSGHSGTKWLVLSQDGYIQIVSGSSGDYKGQFLTLNTNTGVIWIYHDSTHSGTRWRLDGRE